MIAGNLSNIIIFITLVLNTVISLIVFLRNRRSATNVVFFLLGFTILVWLLTTMLSYHPTSAEAALFWIRTSTFFAPLICFFFLVFADTVPNPKLLMKKGYFYGLLLVTFLIMFIIISPFTFVRVALVNGFPDPTPGPGMLPFLIFVILTISSSIYILLKKLKKTRGVEKHQIKLVILGIVSMPGLILITNVIPILFFHNNSLVTFTPLLTLSFLSITAYAIVKHRFLDIRLIIARSISYLLLIVFFGLFYSLLFAIASSLFTIQNLQAGTVSISTILALLMAFSFQSVKRVIEKYTDNFFYKDHYETSQLLYDLTLIMASTLKFEDLSHQFLSTLISEMRITKAAIILSDGEKIYDVVQEGYTKSPEYSEKNIFSLINQNKTLIFDEMEENDLKKTMRVLEIYVAVPIFTAGEEIGLLVLGEKRSGEIYNFEDIRVIDIIVPEVAVAIKNSLSYDEISRFNITLKKDIEKATADLVAANDKLKELDKLKDEFVSVASHELRSPMTAIKNYLWLAIDKTKGEKGDLPNYLNIAYSSTERLLNLVEDMLTVSRIEGKRLILKNEKVNLSEVVNQVYNELVINAEKNKIKVNIKLDSDDFLVMGDKEKLMEVLENLFSNAVKFTPAGGHIDISVSEKDGQIISKVFNSDSYISKEDAAKLFEKFRQLDMSQTKTPQAKGTGLGLYISKQIVELHKGHIEVVSHENEGTSFIIYLPKVK